MEITATVGNSDRAKRLFSFESERRLSHEHLAFSRVLPILASRRNFSDMCAAQFHWTERNTLALDFRSSNAVFAKEDMQVP